MSPVSETSTFVAGRYDYSIPPYYRDAQGKPVTWFLRRPQNGRSASARWPESRDGPSECCAVAAVLADRGYRLGRTIGRGSYAKVKVVERVKDNAIFAVKIILRRKAAKEFLTRFLPRELSVLVSIQHPNIVQVFEVIQLKETVCLITEFAERGDLLIFIKRRGYVAEVDARVIFQQICHAVLYLHDYSICHRDLKCENVLLRNDGSIALTDFGFSKMVDPLNIMSDTHCGSTAYASPELLRDKPYDPFLSDVWSMGCILFITVTGRMPFHDVDPKKTTYRQLVGKAVYPSRHPIVSDPCKDLISHALEPNPERRYSVSQLSCHPWVTNRGTLAPERCKKGDSVTSSIDPEEKSSRVDDDQRGTSGKTTEGFFYSCESSRAGNDVVEVNCSDDNEEKINKTDEDDTLAKRKSDCYNNDDNDNDDEEEGEDSNYFDESNKDTDQVDNENKGRDDNDNDDAGFDYFYCVNEEPGKCNIKADGVCGVGEENGVLQTTDANKDTADGLLEAEHSETFRDTIDEDKVDSVDDRRDGNERDKNDYDSSDEYYTSCVDRGCPVIANSSELAPSLSTSPPTEYNQNPQNTQSAGILCARKQSASNHPSIGGCSSHLQSDSPNLKIDFHDNRSIHSNQPTLKKDQQFVPQQEGIFAKLKKNLISLVSSNSAKHKIRPDSIVIYNKAKTTSSSNPTTSKALPHNPVSGTDIDMEVFKSKLEEILKSPGQRTVSLSPIRLDKNRSDVDQQSSGRNHVGTSSLPVMRRKTENSVVQNSPKIILGKVQKHPAVTKGKVNNAIQVTTDAPSDLDQTNTSESISPESIYLFNEGLVAQRRRIFESKNVETNTRNKPM